MKLELLEKEKERERKKRVIRLHIEGKPQHKIAADEHMSLTLVTAITKPLDEAISRILDGPNDEILAVALFAKGKDRIHVHRNLNMKMAEVDRIYYGCLDWIKDDGLRKIRRKIGDEHLADFIELFYKVQKFNVKIVDIALISESIGKITLLQEEEKRTTDYLRVRSQQKQDLGFEIERLKTQKTQLENQLSSLNIACNEIRREVSNLERILSDLQSKIKKIRNEKEYQDFLQKVIKGVAKECRDILSDVENISRKVLEYWAFKGQADIKTITKMSEEFSIAGERLQDWLKRVELGEWDIKPINSDQGL